jgi:molecular chaperone DnaK
LGGGTFDVSIVRSLGNAFDILATNGEPHLGGQDFNNRVRDKVIERFAAEHGYMPTQDKDPLFFQDLSERIESLKIALSAKDEATLVARCDGMLLNMKIKRVEFESWNSDLQDKTIDRTMKTIEESGLTPAEIGEVFAVGGSSLMPMIPRALEQALGKKPSRQCEPHYAAACGAVIAARIECQRRSKPFVVNGVSLPAPDIHLRDIISHSIGVSVVTDDNKMVCNEILPKGTQIPSIQIRTFKLEVPNQTKARIEVLQGEEGQPRDKAVVLGHFDLTGLPPRGDTTERIEVELNLDSSGLLTAVARDRESGKTAQLQIDYKREGDEQEHTT